jgi:hypothetical protein
MCEVHLTGRREALAVCLQATSDLLAVRNEFRAYCQRIIHASFAALLAILGGFTGKGREDKTKERQSNRRPKIGTRKTKAKVNSGAPDTVHVAAASKAAPMPSATAARRCFDSAFSDWGGSISWDDDRFA